MNRRFALILPIALLFALAATHAAPTRRKPAPPPPPPPPIGDTVRVVLTTDFGAITLELDHKHAPITTENFVAYVDQKRFDGTVFYRALRLDWGTQPNGLIQGGTQNDPRRILPPIAHEPTSQTGILHKAGTISMARYDPGTATGDFSIMLSDQPALDADPRAAGDNQGYAAFGHVVGGEDVVRRIFDAPLSPTAGEGALKGQILAQPVKILTARREAAPVAVASPTTP